MGGRAQLVPQMLLARQKLMPCDMSTYAGSTVGKGVRRPGDTSAASSDLPRARAVNSSRPARGLCSGSRGAACEALRAASMWSDTPGIACVRARAVSGRYCRTASLPASCTLLGLRIARSDYVWAAIPRGVHASCAWPDPRRHSRPGGVPAPRLIWSRSHACAPAPATSTPSSSTACMAWLPLRRTSVGETGCPSFIIRQLPASAVAGDGWKATQAACAVSVCWYVGCS